ncbi:unnamed protein product, partial [Thlaspi arvense]
MHLLKTAIDPSFWISSNRRRSTDGCEAWSSGGGLVLFMTRSVPRRSRRNSSRRVAIKASFARIRRLRSPPPMKLYQASVVSEVQARELSDWSLRVVGSRHWRMID